MYSIILLSYFFYPFVLFKVLQFWHDCCFKIIFKVIVLSGNSEIKNINRLGQFYRSWSFCESGQYAATLTEYKGSSIRKLLFGWFPLIDLSQDEATFLRLYVYNTAKKKIYSYGFIDLEDTNVHGFYWQKDNLVVIHLNYSRNELELRLYKVDHNYQYANLQRKRSFPFLLEQLPHYIRNTVPYLEEILINEQAYTPITFHGGLTRIFLIPRSMGSLNLLKEYNCHCIDRGNIIQDDIGLGIILYTCFPAIKGSILYFVRRIYYPEKEIYKFEFNKYICIDLSKMNNVYGEEDAVDIENIMETQDIEAVFKKTVRRHAKSKKDDFCIFGKFHSITTYNNHQFTYVQEVNVDNNNVVQTKVYHLNLATQRVSILRMKENHKNGLSVSLHPLGFFVNFSPQRLTVGKQFASNMDHFVVPSLKGILAAKIFFSEEYDETTVQDLKFVIY